MKLFYANASPYSRKVRMVVIEKGLTSRVETVLVDPFGNENSNENQELIAANPLGKIPTLLLDSGSALYDSPVICHYLDDFNNSPYLIPDDETQRLDVLRWEALADGIMDAAYNMVMERRRPSEEQSASWMARWSAEIQRALEYVDNHLDELSEELSLAHIALGTAIGYLDFRLSTLLYDSACPQVAIAPNVLSWYQAFQTRPAMQATRPS